MRHSHSIRSRHTTRTSLLGAVSLLACGGSPPPAAAPSAPQQAAPAVAVSGRVAPEPAPNVAPPAPVSPFVVLGQLPADLTLHGVGAQGFLVSASGIELSLVGDEVEQDPLLKRGLPLPTTEMFEAGGVAGRWPDAAWLATTHPYARTGFSTLWSWNGKQWSRQRSTTPGFFVDAIQPWISGSFLALEQSGMLFDARFRVFRAPPGAVLPQFDPVQRGGDFSLCVTPIRAAGFVAFASGDVVVAGLRCDPASTKIEPVVVRWAPGRARGVTDVLPGTGGESGAEASSWEVTAVAASSPTDVFVAAVKSWSTKPDNERHTAQYFAHFDGKQWSQLPAPVPEGVQRLWVLADGSLLALSPWGEIWSSTSEPLTAPWTRVPLPQLAQHPQERTQVLGLWPRAPGDYWAVARVTAPDATGRGVLKREYLLHTRPATKPLPTLQEIAVRERELRLPGPPVDVCPTPFVLLYTLGRNAPLDYDYPATRAALKGQSQWQSSLSFLEFTREGRRYFGARVPNFELGKQLASLVKAKVAGATPQLVCHDPPDHRPLRLNLSTGEIEP